MRQVEEPIKRLEEKVRGKPKKKQPAQKVRRKKGNPWGCQPVGLKPFGSFECCLSLVTS